ncbi:MAG: (Fe-S)-binding protein [Desulfatiglandales bacterium]
MQAVTPYLEVTDAIVEVAGETLKICIQCGMCVGICPWNLVKEFSPRGMIRLAQFGLEGFESEALWNCVTCNNCVQKCPRGVEIIDVIRSMRALMNETGSIPASLKGPIGSLSSRGNPWSGEREERTKWAEGLDVKPFTEDTEYFFFACCTSAYDPRNHKVARAMVQVLQECGVDLGIIGTDENCCGDALRKMGGEDLFLRMAEGNVRLFNDRGVRKIVVTSPHCLNSFGNEYKELGGDFEVVHYTELLCKLLEQGKLLPKKELSLRVTYHDPCYLGRHNEIYDPPRELIRSIPGIEFVKMRRNREESLCCGGGGGGIWMEVPSGERFSELRVAEAEETGADTIAAACPYCISMFEDALKTTGRSESMRVLDISELLLEAIDK